MAYGVMAVEFDVGNRLKTVRCTTNGSARSYKI